MKGVCIEYEVYISSYQAPCTLLPDSTRVASFATYIFLLKKFTTLV